MSPVGLRLLMGLADEVSVEVDVAMSGMRGLAHKTTSVPILHHLQSHSVRAIRVLALVEGGHVGYFLQLLLQRLIVIVVLGDNALDFRIFLIQKCLMRKGVHAGLLFNLNRLILTANFLMHNLSAEVNILRVVTLLAKMIR